MMAGDERYLLTRDQGPVRRYVRDIVDRPRNVLGLFMRRRWRCCSSCSPCRSFSLYLTGDACMMALMALDGVILGRKGRPRVDEKFPDNTESRWKIGLYAASRASQMRPDADTATQVKHGASVD